MVVEELWDRGDEDTRVTEDNVSRVEGDGMKKAPA